MSKDKLIPELRFPDFKKMGEWEINEFGELINILADFTANGSFASLKENVTYYSSEEYAVLVRTTDLDKKIFTPARFTDKRGYEFLSKTSLFGNEIVMANVGSIGKVFRVPNYDKPMTLAPNTYVLKFNDFVDEDFIYQLMLRAEFEKKLLSMVGSSTLMAINKSNLRSIKVSIPAKKEQQKIASCLLSLDELIADHSQKLDLLKDHKKSLMQNLFPQDGEKVPKYRFKDFEKDGEWEIKEFGDLINILSDYTANGSFASLKENVTYYSSLEYAVLVRTTDLDKKIFTPQRFTDKRGYEFLSKTSLFGNEIVMANVGSIGKVFRVPYYDRPMTLAPNTYVLKFNDFVDEDFVYQLMLRTEFEHKLLSMVGSSTLMAINKSNLRSIKVSIPKKDEQQKIAKCLSSLDALINAQDEKIEQLKWHKKGLMQGLFPKFQD